MQKQNPMRIDDVSDTSLLVAGIRAMETARKDALFSDPYAEMLIRHRAREFEAISGQAAQFTQWTVIMRTLIIDRFLRELIDDGVTTFVNLGAGLDARPYRMALPQHILWIEVDFPHIIAHKNSVLKNENPTCELQRFGQDLSKSQERRTLFKKIAENKDRVCILTEGVIPYLTQQQVYSLGEDICREKAFSHWICEYLSPMTYKHLQNPKRMRQFKNAPFQFFPDDWLAFFKTLHWTPKQTVYYEDIAKAVGRPSPIPPLIKLMIKLLGSKQQQEKLQKMSGFLLLERD